MPGQNCTADAERKCGADPEPAGCRLTVKGSVLGRHDAGRDEKGDAGIVDAGEAFHERLLGDAVERVPHGAADEAFCGGEKEHGCDEDV